ncbi:MAG: ABC transporter substrate-binding protein [Rhodospirillaceae bacterium]|nr:ABC transporter substrate-binding protein [Rhodospirillaceae bacterium]
MRRIAYIFLCFFAFLGAPAQAVLVTDKPAAVMMVEKLNTALLDNMKQGKELNFAARKEKIAPVVQEVFDLETMTRVSVGSGWQKLSEDDRKKLTEAFAGWTIATYASQFKNWSGEEFIIKDFTDPQKPDVMVNTEIKPKTGKATVLNYRLRQKPTEKNDGPWQVIDILLDGSVSQLALRRADFAAVFNSGGAPALITHLNALTGKLEAAG